jgi:hypothetical protein
MKDTLGICATGRNSLPHLLGIAEAAVRAGKRVEIFITGEAARFTQDSRFAEVIAIAEVGICEVSYIAAGYQGVEIPGLTDKDYVTQARNAELVERCERYLLI